MEINTEADHNDLTKCSHDDEPSTGTFAVYFLSVLYSVYLVCCFLWPARKSYMSIDFICFFILVQKNVKCVEEFRLNIMCG